MNTLLEISIYIGVFYIALLLLKTFIKPNVKRRIILSIPLLSLAIVFIKQSLIKPIVTIPIYYLDTFTVTQEVGSTNAPSSILTLESIYLLGLSISILFLCYKLATLWLSFLKAKKEKEHGVYVSYNQKQNNFSFFNWISVDEKLNDNERDIVIKHELLHVKKNHSVDVIYFELIKTILWFNPFVYLLKNELEKVHEEEVDAEMYSHHGNDYIEFMLTQSFQSTFNLTQLHNPFFNSKFNLKNRINIMKTQKKNYLALALAFPVIALSIAVTSCEQDKVEKVLQKAELPLPEVSAEYEGGMEALMTYLKNEINYPEEAKLDSIEGKVFVTFYITEEGKVADTWVRNEGKTHTSLEQEALRVVANMPNWKPATTKGKSVKSEFTLPINFTLK